MQGNLNVFFERLRWVQRCVVKRRRLVVLVAWLLALAGAAVVTVVPNRYEATARIYVDTETVLKPLMSGLAFQPDIDERVRMLARTIVSRPNAERLIDNPKLELTPKPQDRERALTDLIRSIIIKPAGGNNLYSITYRDTKPERAQRLVQAVMDLFVNTGANNKRRDSEAATKFIDAQIASYEHKLTEAENRLKDFKLRNFGVSGVSGQDYFTRVSQQSDEVRRLRIELQGAEQSRDALRRELSAEEPQLPLTAQMAGAPPPAVPEIDQRIDSQRKQLDDLLRRYTDAHPDVIAARRTIAQLEQQKQRDEQKRAADGAVGKAATSPIYQRIRVALAEAEAKVASLRSQVGAQQARLDETRKLASRVPQAEAELAQLNRDYDILRKNYDELVSRRESASLGLKLDETSQLAEFRVVEPPRTAPKPVFPSRLHLAVLATLVAFAGGILAALVLDVINPAVEDEAALKEVSKRPVLGSVSISVNESGRRQERLSLMRLGLALGMLLIVQASWIVWIGMHNPLVQA